LYFNAYCQSMIKNRHLSVKNLGKISFRTPKAAGLVESRCYICNADFFPLQTHMAEKHRETQPFECDYCRARIWSKCYLEPHMNMHIESMEFNSKCMFVCELCPFINFSLGGLRTHRKKAHNLHTDARPICCVCAKTFKTQSKLRKHERKHFTCRICGEACTSKTKLKAHSLKHEEQAPKTLKFICYVCGKGSQDFQRWKDHNKTHTNTERNHTCDFCGWKAKTKPTILSHIIHHVNERKYKCSICNKRFNFSRLLRRHELTHKADRPKFKCQVCGKDFFTTKGHQDHLKLHQGDLRFSCDHCTNKYTNHGHLRRHLWKEHSVKSFECQICNTSFLYQHELKKHHYEKHYKK